jgi:hypothetical protein
VAHPLLEQARLEVSLARTAVREGPEAMPMIGLEVDLAAWGEENLMKGVTIPVKVCSQLNTDPSARLHKLDSPFNVVCVQRWKAHLWGQRLAAARRHNCALLSYMQNGLAVLSPQSSFMLLLWCTHAALTAAIFLQCRYPAVRRTRWSISVRESKGHAKHSDPPSPNGIFCGANSIPGGDHERWESNQRRCRATTSRR